MPRFCPECGHPREDHPLVPGVERRDPPPPHSGGRSAGSMPRRHCALKHVNKVIGAKNIAVMRPDMAELNRARLAREELREMDREDREEGETPVERTPHFRVVRKGPRGSGSRGRFRPGEARSPA